MKILFEKASYKHSDTIFSWLAEPHIQEFWDNSKEHKEDILNFIHARPQFYFSGITKYWIGYTKEEPYAFILSYYLEKNKKDLPEIYKQNMSKTGHTIALDFAIGNKKYLGCGLGAPTLLEFTNFYKNETDRNADTFLIDPDENNPRAIHVYSKAGFYKVGKFIPEKGYFVGTTSDLMVKKI